MFSNKFENLVELKWHEGADVKPLLLRLLTDLYVQRHTHTSEEEQQFVELMLRLLDAANAGVRTEVAERLAPYAGTPRAVVHRLVTDVPSVAQPILKARLPSEANEARGGEPQAGNASELNELFFTATPDERRMIMINLDYAAGAALQRMPDAHVREASKRLEAAALQGRPDEFVRELEHAMQISRAQAQRIVNDPSGEPLVVAAKVLAMPVDVLQRILLCVNPAIGHSVRRIYSLTALYKDMSTESAWRLSRIWQQAAPNLQPNATHQPVRSNEDARSVRSSFTRSRHNLAQELGRRSRLGS
jgi:hypothetical protein